VYIPPEKMTGHPVTTPAAAPSKPKVEFSATNGQDNQSKLKGSTCAITQNIEFVCSATDLYNTFFDPNRLRVWTRSGNSVCNPVPGTEYAVFDRNVTGKILSVDPNKKIVMTWRLRTWPANHFSKVEILLEEGSGSTMLKLKQTEVPIGEKEITTRNWAAYYWNPIKGAFGFGATF
jgi:activator of HSP90 ATPase